jgi:hypothetical protein
MRTFATARAAFLPSGLGVRAPALATQSSVMAQDTRTSADGRHGAESVVAWRVRRLVAAGFDPRLAERVARDCAYDLHALIGLAERGCPPALAVRIVAPLDEGPHLC